MKGDAIHSEAAAERSAPAMLPLPSPDAYLRDLEASVRHRDAVLAAVGYAAARFLGTEDWQRDIQDVLGRLGAAAEVSRVYLFESFRDEQGVVRATMRHEWTAPGVAPRIDVPEVQNLPLGEVGLVRWPSLEQGVVIHGPVRSLLPSERDYFTRVGIRSIAVMPVFAGVAWWGWLGFTDDVTEREWSPSLLEVLRTAAAMLGGALYRKRTEQELRESEERFRRLAEAAVEGIFIHDQGVVLDANPALAKMFGYEPEELLGRNIIEMVATPESKEVILRHMRAGSEARYEATGRRKDGSPIICEITARWTTHKGRRRARVAAIHDITERKLAEEALRRREAQLAEAQELAHLGSWEWDIVRDTVTCSDELYRIYGVEPGAVTPQSLVERIHPDDWPRVWEESERARAQGGVCGSEYRIVRPDGTVRVVRDQGKVFVDAAGKAVRMVGTVQDITERKEAEARERQLIRERAARAEAERAERRARFLAEASRVLGTSFDYHTTLSTLVRLAVPGVADYSYVDVISPAGTVECLGVAHADPVKEPLLAAAAEYTCHGPPEGHPLRAALVEGTPIFMPSITREMLRAGVTSDEHWRLVEQLQPESLVAVPLRVSNRILGALALFTAKGRSLTADDLVLAEELARRASLAIENARLYHAAQQATQARDEVLGVVAHDLRNPLGTITMAADLLLEVTADAAGSLGRRQVDIIRRSAARMSRLIQDLLDVRRIEGGQLAVEPRPLSVRALVEEAAEMLRPLAAASSLVLELELPDDVPRVMADPVRIQQVLSNLVGNAIKFTPAGGRICVSAWSVADEVCLSVVDTGPGIPPDQMPHIFGRFWQARRADRRGIGLGLAIAKGLVEAHGGRIWAESRVGHGSSFFFALPVVACEVPAGVGGGRI